LPWDLADVEKEYQRRAAGAHQSIPGKDPIGSIGGSARPLLIVTGPGVTKLFLIDRVGLRC